MDTTIEVTPREGSGKGGARKLRASGRVPGVVYGPAHDAQAISLQERPLLDLFKHTGDRNTIVKLKVGDADSVPCLVREVQRHPLRRDILHVDFYRVPEDREIEVMVPLETVGRPKGAILGGRVRLIRRQVKIRCKWNLIPRAFEVDVSPMDIGDMIKASEVPTPEGVNMVLDHDYNVISVYGKKRAAVKADEEAEA